MSAEAFYYTPQARQAKIHEIISYYVENPDRLGPGAPVDLEAERLSIARALRVYYWDRGAVQGGDLANGVRETASLSREDRVKYLINPRIKKMPARERDVILRMEEIETREEGR